MKLSWIRFQDTHQNCFLPVCASVLGRAQVLQDWHRNWLSKGLVLLQVHFPRHEGRDLSKKKRWGLNPMQPNERLVCAKSQSHKLTTAPLPQAALCSDPTWRHGWSRAAMGSRWAIGKVSGWMCVISFAEREGEVGAGGGGAQCTGGSM